MDTPDNSLEAANETQMSKPIVTFEFFSDFH